MTSRELAEALRAAHPDADPLCVPVDDVIAWSEEAGAGRPAEDALAAVLAAWAELVA